MKPIINPWLFYFIDTICGMKIYILVFAICTLFAYSIVIFVYLLDGELPPWIKKKHLLIIASFIIAALFIPSKSTIYKMIIASYTTPNNIEIVKDTGKDLIDYIIEKAGELESVKQE